MLIKLEVFIILDPDFVEITKIININRALPLLQFLGRLKIVFEFDNRKFYIKGYFAYTYRCYLSNLFLAFVSKVLQLISPFLFNNTLMYFQLYLILTIGTYTN